MNHITAVINDTGPAYSGSRTLKGNIVKAKGDHYTLYYTSLEGERSLPFPVPGRDIRIYSQAGHKLLMAWQGLYPLPLPKNH